MGPHAERICYVENDLRLLQKGDLAAVESPDLLMGVLQQLSELDAVSWLEVLRELKEGAPELHDVVKEVKAVVDMDAIRLRIGTVGHRVGVDANGRVVVDLEFYSFGESPYRSRADLEDTLWVAMSIMKALASSMESARNMLSAPSMRQNLGRVFSKNLRELEKQTTRVRELYREIAEEG